MMKKSLAFAVVSLAAVLCPQAHASVVFSGSSGSLAASAKFDIVGGQLQVKLANTSAADVLVPTNVLTAVYFNVTGNPMLTRISATSGGDTYLGSTLVSSAGTTVGGEWAYLNSLSQYGANSGISSSGMGIFGPGDVFPGANLSGPIDPDGVQYGITSALDNPLTGNAPITGSPLTKGSVSFLLGSIPTGFSLSNIGNVTFQYGTALGEGHFGGGTGVTIASVPEPAPLTLLAAGLVAIGLSRRRRA